MTTFQELWWERARSDHEVLVLLRREGYPECHQLHYLQMATEKLAKAYFWRSGSPPPRNHAGFVQFLRFLGGIPRSERASLIAAVQFKSFESFQGWLRAALGFGRRLEILSPALASDGENLEYPWPHHLPARNPVRHKFALWDDLSRTPGGRQFLRFVGSAIENFPAYA
jgi:hypothetical protein